MFSFKLQERTCMKNHEIKCPHVVVFTATNTQTRLFNLQPHLAFCPFFTFHMTRPHLPHLPPFPPCIYYKHCITHYSTHPFPYPDHHGGRFPPFSFFPKQAAFLRRRPPSTQASNFPPPSIHQFTLQIPSLDLLSQGRDRQSQILVVHRQPHCRLALPRPSRRETRT